jgi:hypothetical protein
MFVSRGLLEAARFALIHSLIVLAGNAFLFFACIAVQGFLLNALGGRLFVRISRLAQLLLLVFLLSFFFLMPAVKFAELRDSPALLSAFPPAWFLGLYQTLLAGPTPEFLPLAAQAVAALGLASFGFGLTFVLAYSRRLRKTLEVARNSSSADSRVRGYARALWYRFMLRIPKERAAFCFIAKTLARSQIHRTCFGAYLGFGLAFVVMGVVTVVARHGYAGMLEPRSELLSIPLVLSFFLLLGLRVAFSIPSCLDANWLFRLTDGQGLADCSMGVQKAMFVLGVLPVIVPLYPLHAALWGWTTASLHAAFCTLLSLVLIQVLVLRLDKIPFTCTYLPGKANLKMWWWLYLFGFITYAYTMAGLERRWLQNPRAFLAFVGTCVAVLVSASIYRRHLIARLAGFRYEAYTPPVAEPLNMR